MKRKLRSNDCMFTQESPMADIAGYAKKPMARFTFRRSNIFKSFASDSPVGRSPQSQNSMTATMQTPRNSLTPRDMPAHPTNPGKQTPRPQTPGPAFVVPTPKHQRKRKTALPSVRRLGQRRSRTPKISTFSDTDSIASNTSDGFCSASQNIEDVAEFAEDCSVELCTRRSTGAGCPTCRRYFCAVHPCNCFAESDVDTYKSDSSSD